MDAATGKILYQKEPDLRLPPASTTKVVTALVALESERKLDERLKVSKKAPRVPASKLHLRAGQSMTMQDLLYAILLSSANDASVVLAEGIGGSVAGFSDLMNKKARSIGAMNTHFTNPHGLTASNHYSTVRDLATIFRYAMTNRVFRDVVQTKIGSVHSRSVVKKKVINRRIAVRNHNRLLWNFDGAIGGKTGYTHAAQRCFVGAVQRNGVTLIVAILGARELWNDTRKLLEYGFDHHPSSNDLTPAVVRVPAEKRDGVESDSSPAFFVPLQEESGLPSADGYIVQVGSFRERHRAESVLDDLSAIGFDAFLEQADVGNGHPMFRVRVGPYAELLEAQETAEQILKESGYETLILPGAAEVNRPS